MRFGRESIAMAKVYHVAKPKAVRMMSLIMLFVGLGAGVRKPESWRQLVWLSVKVAFTGARLAEPGSCTAGPGHHLVSAPSVSSGPALRARRRFSLSR